MPEVCTGRERKSLWLDDIYTVTLPLLFKLSWKLFPCGFDIYLNSLKQQQVFSKQNPSTPISSFQASCFFHSICSSSEWKKLKEWYVPKCMFNKVIESVWIKQNSNCSVVWAVLNSCCNTLFQWIIILLQRAKHLNYEARASCGHNLWCRSSYFLHQGCLILSFDRGSFTAKPNPTPTHILYPDFSLQNTGNSNHYPFRGYVQHKQGVDWHMSMTYNVAPIYRNWCNVAIYRENHSQDDRIHPRYVLCLFIYLIKGYPHNRI